jgi:hypothetical protein
MVLKTSFFKKFSSTIQVANNEIPACVVVQVKTHVLNLPGRRD